MEPIPLSPARYDAPSAREGLADSTHATPRGTEAPSLSSHAAPFAARCRTGRPAPALTGPDAAAAGAWALPRGQPADGERERHGASPAEFREPATTPAPTRGTRRERKGTGGFGGRIRPAHRSRTTSRCVTAPTVEAHEDPSSCPDGRAYEIRRPRPLALAASRSRSGKRCTMQLSAEHTDPNPDI